MKQNYRHATSVSMAGFAILIEGAPKSGKSSLALSLIDLGAKLISDDLTFLKKEGDFLYALPTDRMSGCMYIRELGILKIDAVETKQIRVGAIIRLLDEDCVNSNPEYLEILGKNVPVFHFKKYDFALTNKINAVIKILTNKWEIMKI